MPNIEDRLGDWSIRSKAVRDIGRQVRDLTIECSDAYTEHAAMSDENIEGHLEGNDLWRLATHAKQLGREARRVHGETAFEETALRQFAHDLSSLQTYFCWAGHSLRYFHVDSESQIQRRFVARLVDSLFLPGFNLDTPEPVAVSSYQGRFPRGRGLAHRASIASYHAHPSDSLRRRKELLRQYVEWGDISTPQMQQHQLAAERSKVRKVALDCLSSYGLVSAADIAEIERIHAAAEKYETHLASEWLAGRVVDFTDIGTPEHLLGLVVDNKDRAYRFIMDWQDNLYSEADGRFNTIGVRNTTLLVTQDRQTGKFRVFRGDAYWNASHETVHIWHWLLSRSMPLGLDNDSRGYSWATLPHVEGVTTWSETALMMNYLRQHYRELGMTESDLEATLLREPDREKRKRARLFYRTHHLAKASTAAEQTYKDTRNTVHKSDLNFPQEHLASLLFLHSYDLGGPEIHSIFNELRAIEADRLGSPEAADSFMQEHYPLIVRGVFTGAWTLKELRPWMFGHYMPRLRRLVKSNPAGSQISVPADIPAESQYVQPATT